MYDAALPSRRRPRILIVEPNPGAAELVGEVLGTVGCDIAGPCSTLDEAIALLNAGAEVDGAVLEMRVSGSFSFELAALLLNRNRAVIFFTRCDPGMLPPHLHVATILEKPRGIELLAEAAVASFFPR